MKNSTLKAPAHLRPDTRAWWQSVHQDYELEEHHSRLLTMVEIDHLSEPEKRPSKRSAYGT